MTPNATTDLEALLLVEATEGIATITLNRPSQFNALSSALIGELQAALDGVGADPAVRVVVLAARGRGFCAGHDLKEIRGMADVADVESLFARCSRMMMSLTQLPQPTPDRAFRDLKAPGDGRLALVATLTRPQNTLAQICRIGRPMAVSPDNPPVRSFSTERRLLHPLLPLAAGSNDFHGGQP